MQAVGSVAPSGDLGLRVVRGTVEPEHTPWPCRELSMREIIGYGWPSSDQPENIRAWKKANLPNLWRGTRRVLQARVQKLPTMYGQLFLTVIRGNGNVEHLGLVSQRVITTAGVAFVASAFDNTVEVEILKYHGLGTGTGAEASSDTTLGTELTTEYTGNTRATGTQAHSTNTYTTVGTLTLDSGTPAVTEHGVFSAASTGTLLDRSKFSAINLDGAAGDGIVATYVLTLPAGS